MALTAAPRIARLIPLLGSPNDGEALGAARAIERTLRASGLDLHDLAREIQQPDPAPALPQHTAHTRRERTSRPPRTPRVAPIAAETLRLLRFGLAHDVYSTWEVSFGRTIVEAASRHNWRPSRKQTDTLAKLACKAAEAERCP